MALTTACLTYSQFCLQSRQCCQYSRGLYVDLSYYFHVSGTVKLFCQEQDIWLPKHLNAFLGWTCILNSYNLIVPNRIFKIIKESSIYNFLFLFLFFFNLVLLLSSHSVVSDSLRPHGLQPTRLLCSWDFLDCHFLLQGIFPTQGSKLCLFHWQEYSLSLSHCVLLCNNISTFLGS